MTHSLHDKFTSLRDDLNSSLLERDAAIEAALLALLTGEHLLLLGPPGTGKSMLVRAITGRIEGAILFEHLLTRFSTPEELFGPLSLSALENDQYRRVSDGAITECHVGLIDEIFKANAAILNSLLGLIGGERVYFEGGRGRPVPLMSLFGASNETPEDAGLDALYDRFLLRVHVPYLTDDANVRRLFELEAQPPAATITLDELRAAQAEVDTVSLTEDVVDALITIKHNLESEGIAATDRRWRACARLVKAKAWLDGDTATSAEHCDALVNVLWSEPGEIRVVERLVAKTCNPLNLEAVELEDAARDLYEARPPVDHPNLTEALEPILRQLGDIHTRLESRIQGVPARRATRANKALRQLETWHRALSQLALRSLSVLHLAPGARAGAA